MIPRYDRVSNPEMRFFANINEIQRLHGSDLQAAVQAYGQIDAEMGKKTLSGWKPLRTRDCEKLS